MGHKKQMEGDDTQRKAAAREARELGKSASEMGATLGASKQRKEAKGNEQSHQERLEQRDHGEQRANDDDDQPRPGNRDEDPKRTNDWG